MASTTYALIAFSVFVFALVSNRVKGSVVTLPMVFSALGLALALLFPHFLPGEGANDTVSFLAEITLILVLFSDASRIDLRILIREHKPAVRLLGIGLPLTAALGCLFAAVLFPDLGWAEAAILAVILSPTDAALGQSFVNDPIVPQRVRESLSVESGLNDGICLPLLMIAIVLAGINREIGASPQSWLIFAGEQIVLGFLSGAAVGIGGAWVFNHAGRRKSMTDAFKSIAPLALAVLAYGLAGLITGNGFIAAFTAGICFGHVAPSARAAFPFAEAEGQILTLFVFLLFGFWMAPLIFEVTDWRVWAYALMSLTLIRMVPVALSLIGLGFRFPTDLFMGWFGPRGLASILYVILVLEKVHDGTGYHIERIRQVVTVTVALSILLHGLSAAPLARLYGHWTERRKQKTQKPMSEAYRPTPMPGSNIETTT